jgi:hypothetical protein
MADHPLDKMVRDFQDRITRGTFEGVYDLDGANLDRVMDCQAESCAQAFVELFQISDDLDLDAFLEKMKLGGSSKVEIQRDGNTIRWEEQHAGKCVCPLVTRQVIPLDPALCRCAVHWLRKLFERRAQGAVRVRLLDSVAFGSENCVFEVVVDEPSQSAGQAPS